MNKKQKKIALTLTLGLVVFVSGYYIVRAATFYWDQGSWTGDDTTEENCLAGGGTWADSKCTAVHYTNNTGWTLYSEKDENATTGENVSISLQVEDRTEDETTEFSDGDSVGVTTTGDQVSLDLPF